ncbi:hypothetical protein EBZ39_10040 [bacterium]|nr:hypothetical protein [bacterium]
MAVPGLYTTVKNTSGAARVFGFLGAHGKRLENNETYTVPGDLVAALGANASYKGGRGSQRPFKALEKALEQGTLVITKSPAVYLTDEDDGSIDQVKLSEDTLGTKTPEGWD